MSTQPHLLHLVTLALLALTVATCVLGVLGMWRMRTPSQALHYLSLPSALGSVLLAAAVLCQVGFHAVFFKTAAITTVLLSFNSIVTHATARAFRVRELGHWEPQPGDGTEVVPPKEV